MDKLKASILFFVLLTFCLIISAWLLPFYYESVGEILSVVYYLDVIHIIENGVDYYPMKWSDSELEHTRVLFQVNYAFLILSSICSSLLVFLTVLKYTIPSLRKKIPYSKRIRLFCAVYIPLFIAPVIVTMGALPKAFKIDIETTTGEVCDVGPCVSLNGSVDTTSWGTKSGWVVACIAIIPSLLTLVLIWFKKRRKNRKSDPESKPLIRDHASVSTKILDSNDI